jgi:hypothetical protein
MPNAEDESVDRKIEDLLELIDINGMERIRQMGESLNTRVYHMVMY